MIRGRYGLLVAGVVVAMMSAAAGAGYLMVFSPLPDPSVCTRQQLFRWLVLRDLSNESEETRQKILDRLDTDFQKVDGMGSTIEKMDESRRQMLWHNVSVLLGPWLLGKVDQFTRLPASQRMDYIDRFLDRAEMWNKIGSACSRNDANRGAKEGPKVSKWVMEQIVQCRNYATGEQREQIDSFVTAVQARWLWRQLPSFNLFGNPARAARSGT